jgi:protein-disulfide isomerase
VVVGLLIRREFFSNNSARTNQESLIYLEDWRQLSAFGDLVGAPDGPVQIVEFVDFQCPYCARFHSEVKSVRAKHDSMIGLTLVHFPLERHLRALDAAQATRCAKAEGRFEEMVDFLYTRQVEIGVVPWAEFGERIGLKDLPKFAECMAEEAPVEKIRVGQRLATSAGIRGTPTVLINGWKLSRPPSATELEQIVENILSGNSTFLERRTVKASQ